MPFYESAGVTGEFTGVNGVRSATANSKCRTKRARSCFVRDAARAISPTPARVDLAQAGYSVYVIDHRSQGFSGRLTQSPQLATVVTVENYDVYVADFKTFIDTVVTAVAHPHLYLLTNSMGGAIGGMYLAKYPQTFERAVMSVPMFEINTKGIPEPIGLELAKFETAIGHGDNFAKLGGEKPYDFNYHSDCNSTDSHEVRRCKIEELVTANPGIAWAVRAIAGSCKLSRPCASSARDLDPRSKSRS